MKDQDNTLMLKKFILMNIHHEFHMGRLSVEEYYKKRTSVLSVYANKERADHGNV